MLFGLSLPVVAALNFYFGRGATNSEADAHKLRLPSSFVSSAFVVACVLAALIPLLSRSPSEAQESQRFKGWPRQFEGRELQEESLSPDTSRFANQFPGRIAVFRAGKSRVVYRWANQPTRQMHPCENCYRASGFEIKWLPDYKDAQDNLWSAFQATRGSQKLFVRERFFDDSGHSWTDVSAWYWSAVLQQSKSPCWSVCVAERIDGDRP